MQVQSVAGFGLVALGVVSLCGVLVQVSLPCCGEYWDCNAKWKEDVEGIRQGMDKDAVGFVAGSWGLGLTAGCAGMVGVGNANRVRCCDRAVTSIIFGTAGGCLLMAGIGLLVWGWQERKRALARRDAVRASVAQFHMTFGLPHFAGKGKGAGKGVGFWLGRLQHDRDPSGAPPPFRYAETSKPSKLQIVDMPQTAEIRSGAHKSGLAIMGTILLLVFFGAVAVVALSPFSFFYGTRW